MKRCPECDHKGHEQPRWRCNKIDGAAACIDGHGKELRDYALREESGAVIDYEDMFTCVDCGAEYRWEDIPDAD